MYQIDGLCFGYLRLKNIICMEGFKISEYKQNVYNFYGYVYNNILQVHYRNEILYSF